MGRGKKTKSPSARILSALARDRQNPAKRSQGAKQTASTKSAFFSSSSSSSSMIQSKNGAMQSSSHDITETSDSNGRVHVVEFKNGEKVRDDTFRRSPRQPRGARPLTAFVDDVFEPWFVRANAIDDAATFDPPPPHVRVRRAATKTKKRFFSHRRRTKRALTQQTQRREGAK